jgi:hypothetical protein
VGRLCYPLAARFVCPHPGATGCLDYAGTVSRFGARARGDARAGHRRHRDLRGRHPRARRPPPPPQHLRPAPAPRRLSHRPGRHRRALRHRPARRARHQHPLGRPRPPECWCDIARVVAAADTAFLARVVEPLIGSTPTSWLAFRREGPWTSYDLDPAASVDLPALFITPPPPAADAAPDTRPPVTYEPPRAIPSHLLEDCHARALSIRLTLAGDSRPCTVHRAASDGSRALARVPGAPPALGDAATIIVDAPDGSPALTLAATVGWVDRTSLVDDATELVLVLSTRTPRDFREAWTRRLNASAPG